MSEFRGTGGKWSVSGGKYIRRNGVGRAVACVLHFGDDEPTSEQMPHNAALIAEAGTVRNETGFSPRELAEHRKSLLEALQVTVKWMEWWLANELCECESEHVCGKTQRTSELEQARAAIAEALGETP